MKDTIHKIHKFTEKYLSLLDFIVIIISLTLFSLFRQDIVLMIIFVLVIPYLILTKRAEKRYSLLLSLLIALVWVKIAKNYYDYNSEFIIFSDLSTFPILSWTLGLFGVYIIYSHVKKYFKILGFTKSLLLFTSIYWPLLIIAETIGYHFLGIMLLSSYPGLPICNCIHAVWWMKISYFLIGIIFFIPNYYFFENNFYK